MKSYMPWEMQTNLVTGTKGPSTVNSLFLPVLPGLFFMKLHSFLLQQGFLYIVWRLLADLLGKRVFPPASSN